MNPGFGDLPIRRKLILITLASSAIAIVVASGGFFAWDILQFRREIERDLRAQARTIGENSTAALSFGDPRAAGETLAVLEIFPNVQRGCMYAANGQLFATYYRDAAGSCPGLPAETVDIGWGTARLVVPVTLEDRRIGTLLVERDLNDVLERLGVGGAILVGLFLLATILAVIIGSRMQRTIADPLLRLADTARAVSESKDYTLRGVVTSRDEVGVVVQAFNEMLDRVEERTAELSHANRLKDEFLATLSHELRTPLNAVLGWVHILRQPNVPTGMQARALESIERNARLQARLIEDLLEVSRIVTGKLHLQTRPADLAAIIESAVEVVQAAAAAKSIRVVTDIQSRPAMTVGDPDRLQQVIWNLLSNAVKFTPASGRITVRLRRNHEHVVTVSDTGIGIDPVFLPHVFTLFRQADASPSREHGGLGLGLAIVRQLVELHGGTVSAHSEGVGRGTTFEVRLPSVLPMEAAETRPSPEPPAPRAESLPSDLLAGVEVLVVEDDGDARDLLRTTFASYGANVTTVSSAAEAMRALERGVPDVIVSDIGMATEDGYSLMRRIRARPPAAGGNVPAVALTAYASPADQQAAFAAGYQAHMSKPFEPPEVAALVHKLTGTRLRA
jgi:signal transduction histidine kinase